MKRLVTVQIYCDGDCCGHKCEYINECDEGHYCGLFSRHLNEASDGKLYRCLVCKAEDVRTVVNGLPLHVS
jgi:hypothetical protein